MFLGLSAAKKKDATMVQVHGNRIFFRLVMGFPKSVITTGFVNIVNDDQGIIVGTLWQIM